MSEGTRDAAFLDNMTCTKCGRWFDTGYATIVNASYISGICVNCDTRSDRARDKEKQLGELNAQLSKAESKLFVSRLAAQIAGAIFLATLFGLIPQISNFAIGAVAVLTLIVCAGLYIQSRDEVAHTQSRVDSAKSDPKLPTSI